MTSFFTYTSPYRTGNFMDLNKAEYYLPIFVLFGLIILLYIYKDKFKYNENRDKRFRYIIGVALAVVYSSHYLLRFSLYGFDTILLPFQLCSISMFLAILLLFTKNRTIQAFVLYTGVIGGMISIFVPVIGYDSHYYRYYQYYIAHILLIITPLYFMFVHDYFPSKKETIKGFLILQAIATFMAIFNYFTNSDFMFLFLDPAKIDKFPVIAKFGGIPLYLLPVEIAGVSAFYLMFRLTQFIKSYQVKQIEYQEV